MKKTNLPINANLPDASRLVYGCMGLGGGWSTSPYTRADVKHTHDVIETALENGITIFDHADIYTFGKAEQVFGDVLEQRPELRDRMLIQSKCGIRLADEKGPKRYDFSSQWIEQSVEGILQRLRIEQLDVLLLHRPDPLMDVDEVGNSLNGLVQQGKVAHIGVSNMHSGQMEWLQSRLEHPLVANQIEMSLLRTDWLEEGMTTGSALANDNSFDSHLFSYCHRHNIQLQAWGSLAQGKVTSAARAAEPHEKRAAEAVEVLAAEYQTSPEAIALAWLNRLPIGVQPIIGTTNLSRIKACAQASTVTLSREHWYYLLESTRGNEVP